MTTNFLRYSQYYDLFYKEKNYIAEFQYIRKQLSTYIPDGAHLLELGCGTGKHAEHFCSAGYTVTGIDSSTEMIEQARSKQISGFSAIHNNITSYTIAEKFDAAFSLFHVISYLTTNAELSACFTRTFDHIKPGGIFCFDCWYGPAVLHELPATRVKKLYDHDLELTRVARPVIDIEKNVVQVAYEITVNDTKSGMLNTVKEDHFMRYFTIPEIQWIAEHAGFTMLKAEEYMTSGKTSLNTWNLFVMLQKAV